MSHVSTCTDTMHAPASSHRVHPAIYVSASLHLSRCTTVSRFVLGSSICVLVSHRISLISWTEGIFFFMCYVCDSLQESQEFDAIVVCNGHYSVPNVPFIPGRDEWPGHQMHSHSYRENTPFAGKSVVVLGVSASGEDISREIAEVASKVNTMHRDFKCVMRCNSNLVAPLFLSADPHKTRLSQHSIYCSFRKLKNQKLFLFLRLGEGHPMSPAKPCPHQETQQDIDVSPLKLL
jgi:hypothetical protein